MEEYFITKSGAYYRPKAQGYTSSKLEAGRFTLEEAIKYSHPNGPLGPRDGIRYERAAPMTTQPTQEAPSSDVVEALRTCREQFAFYVTSHKTKGTDDGNMKAAINQNFVDMCDKALASTAGDTLKAELDQALLAFAEHEETVRKLKAENERLRALLTPFAMHGFPIPLSVARSHAAGFPDINREHVQAIRTALGSDQ